MRACGDGVDACEGREGGEGEGARTSISSSKPSTPSSSAKESRASTSASVSLSSYLWGLLASCMVFVCGAGRAHAGRGRENWGRNDLIAWKTEREARIGEDRLRALVCWGSVVVRGRRRGRGEGRVKDTCRLWWNWRDAKKDSCRSTTIITAGSAMWLTDTKKIRRHGKGTHTHKLTQNKIARRVFLVGKAR